MEWKQHLCGYLKEELADSVKYAEISKTTEGPAHQLFHDMAEEEYEHACAVWHMMEREGMTGSMDKHMIFHDARAALHK